MTKKMLRVILFVSLCSLQVHATTFQLMPLEKLIEESNGAAEVELKDKKSFMNKMGLILTEYIFNVSESYNLNNSDLDGELLKITMTGGTVNGITSFIDGAPSFEVGEKSFLLLRKTESAIYISNFTLGKYKVEEKDGSVFYISSVFPSDSDIGIVKKNRMIDMVKLKYKITSMHESNFSSSLRSNRKNSTGLFKKLTNQNKRTPAQEDNFKTEDNGGLIAMWAFFIIFLITGLSIWLKLRKGVSDN